MKRRMNLMKSWSVRVSVIAHGTEAASGKWSWRPSWLHAPFAAFSIQSVTQTVWQFLTNCVQTTSVTCCGKKLYSSDVCGYFVLPLCFFLFGTTSTIMCTWTNFSLYCFRPYQVQFWSQASSCSHCVLRQSTHTEKSRTLWFTTGQRNKC